MSDVDAQHERSGQLLGGRYRVGKQLGVGGMGVVYEATQEDLRRRVAVKVLHAHLAGEKDLVQRFRREAEAAAALGHPHIVQVTDFQWNPPEPPFLVMEHLSGESLRELVKREKGLPDERVARMALQVLDALAASHKAGIVHRDIKPDNVFVTQSAALHDIVKVLDFGVAKLLAPEAADGGGGGGGGAAGGRPLTMLGAVVGTLSYMAPEQARAQAVDGRADLYAVAAVMYFACAGRRPIEGPNGAAADVTAICTQAPLPLGVVKPSVDDAFARVVERGLEKAPDARWQSAEQMSEALNAWLRARGDVPATAPHVAATPAVVRSQEPTAIAVPRNANVNVTAPMPAAGASPLPAVPLHVSPPPSPAGPGVAPLPPGVERPEPTLLAAGVVRGQSPPPTVVERDPLVTTAEPPKNVAPPAPFPGGSPYAAQPGVAFAPPGALPAAAPMPMPMPAPGQGRAIDSTLRTEEAANARAMATGFAPPAVTIAGTSPVSMASPMTQGMPNAGSPGRARRGGGGTLLIVLGGVGVLLVLAALAGGGLLYFREHAAPADEAASSKPVAPPVEVETVAATASTGAATAAATATPSHGAATHPGAAGAAAAHAASVHAGAGGGTGDKERVAGGGAGNGDRASNPAAAGDGGAPKAAAAAAPAAARDAGH